jgi:glutathione S-transferase
MQDEFEQRPSRRAAIAGVGLGTAALIAGAAHASAPADKVTIYHIEGRRSQRIIWLCEELNIPYEVKFKRGDTMASLNMIKAVNPAMPMAPTVVFRGKTMVESGGIIEYLMSQFPGGEKLAPPRNSPDYADYKMWIHYAEGTAACRIGTEAMRIMASHDTAIKPATIGGVFRIVGAQDVVDYLEHYIAAHPYFGGQTFSAADVMMDFVVTYISVLPFDPATYRNLIRWQKTVQARPAYQRAFAVGAPDGLEKFATPKPKKGA